MNKLYIFMQGLVDNKKEYTKYIQESLTIPIAEKIKSFYDISISNKSGLKGFQNELNKIKEWNNNYIDDIYNNILKKSKYKNIDKLYKFVIITSIKIKIYEYKDSINNVNIKYPSIQDYIHKCFMNVGTWVWKNPFLFFKNNLREIEIQNNYNIVEKNIKKIIKNTLIECIPIDSIIQQIEDRIANNNDNLIEQYVELDVKEKEDDEENIVELNNNSNDSTNKLNKNQETFTSSLFSAISRNTNKLNRFLTKKDNDYLENKNDNDFLENKNDNDYLENNNDNEEIISDAETDKNSNIDNNIIIDNDNEENEQENQEENQQENQEENQQEELEIDNNITVKNMDLFRDKYNNTQLDSDSDSNSDSDSKSKNNNFISDNSYDSSASSISDSDNEKEITVKKMY